MHNDSTKYVIQDQSLEYTDGLYNTWRPLHGHLYLSKIRNMQLTHSTPVHTQYIYLKLHSQTDMLL